MLALASAPAPATATVLVSLPSRREAALTRLLARQTDPASPDFERWLTPAEFGRRFGARAADLRRASGVLRQAGCRVQRFASRQLLACRSVRSPALGEGRLIRDAIDLDVPLPLLVHLRGPGIGQRVTFQGTYFLSPAEFLRIYHLDGVRGAGIDGSGRGIGIVAGSAIALSDLNLFRGAAGLPLAELTQSGGAGLRATALEQEAMLDATWSGALAPGARLHVAVGLKVVDSLARLVNRRNIDVITSSLDVCEARGVLGRRLERTGRRLFRQARAQGQTVVFASGDSGSRECLSGLGTFTSSPLVTSVGGTTPTPVVGPDGIATGYGTEAVWNEGDAASGGGPTSERRPSYQHGPAERRTIPDVAFPASRIFPIVFDGFAVCCFSGTSAAAPAWAGVVALVDQQRGRRAGLMNPRLYDLGRAQAAGGPAVFHDVTVGDNSIPAAIDFSGGPGYPATPGYDLATGWGSIDGQAFLDAWGR
jgi:subtilase family serine protease